MTPGDPHPHSKRPSDPAPEGSSRRLTFKLAAGFALSVALVLAVTVTVVTSRDRVQQSAPATTHTPPEQAAGPRHRREQQSALLPAYADTLPSTWGAGDGSLPAFNWSIYVVPEVPRGFRGSARPTMRRAIASWKRLVPAPRIVLVGSGWGFDAMALEEGIELQRGVDLNLMQMPLANSVVKLATSGSNSDVTMLLQDPLVLTHSIVASIIKANSQFSIGWLMCGGRSDLTYSGNLPATLEPANAFFAERSFSQFVRESGGLHSSGDTGGADYLLWSNPPQPDGSVLPVLPGVIPAFILGRGKFENWLIHEVITAGKRDVIDATEAVVAVRIVDPFDDTEFHKGGSLQTTEIVENEELLGMVATTSDWQLFHNIHLALHSGTYAHQNGTSLHAPWKLTTCVEQRAVSVCLMRRKRPNTCPCEYSPFKEDTQSDTTIVETKRINKKGRIVGRTKLIKCGSVVSMKTNHFQVPAIAKPESPVGLPFTLDQVLRTSAQDNHVIVTGVSYNYRDMLMNFVCNLRRLGMCVIRQDMVQGQGVACVLIDCTC